MKLIAHRGNTDGPSKYENQPTHILEAINKGYDVEVDVRYCSGNLWLGHDKMDFLLGKDLFDKIIPHAWFHCKDIQSLEYLSGLNKNINFFFHDSDDYVVTSQGYIWAYPGKIGKTNTVIVMPEYTNTPVPADSYAVCSDYVSKYQSYA